MFGFMKVSTHEAELERHGATIAKLAAEKRTVETLLSRIARRDARIATLETDKAAVESELRLVNEANTSLTKRIAKLEKAVAEFDQIDSHVKPKSIRQAEIAEVKARAKVVSITKVMAAPVKVGNSNLKSSAAKVPVKGKVEAKTGKVAK